MAEDKKNLFYGELASWWPLISPLEDYEEEATEFARILSERVSPLHTLLELGSGGGHNAWYMKRLGQMTLSDLSAGMLERSRAINPDCEHVQGDMRTIDLKRTFDAVFIHDAIEYMCTESDLLQAMQSAHRHLRPGGLAVFVPDATAETFEPETDCGGADDEDGQSVRYLEWSFDPDPDDNVATTIYSFVLREADGTLRYAQEEHAFGLFPRETWLRLLREAGLEPEILLEQTEEDRAPRQIFLGRRTG